MADAFIDAGDLAASKLQTFKNPAGPGGAEVHAEGVVLVDQNGVPFTPTNRFPVNLAGADGATIVSSSNPLPVSGSFNEFLVNPSLLEDINGNGVPDGWFVQAPGTYTAAESAWTAPASIGANADILIQSATAVQGHYKFRVEAKRISGTGTLLAHIEFYDSALASLGGYDGAAESQTDYFVYTVAANAPSNAAYRVVWVRASTVGDVWRLRRASLIYTKLQECGVWGYRSGVSGTPSFPANARILQITAIALEAAGSITINGGNTIPIPYGATDSVSSDITIIPKGNLVAPTIVFTGTDGYFCEFVT